MLLTSLSYIALLIYFKLSLQLPTQTNLILNTTIFEMYNDPLHYYILNLTREDNTSPYIQISTISSIYNTANIFISKKNENPSFIDSDFQTYTKNPNSVILSKDYYNDIEQLFITISCVSACEYTISVNKYENIILERDRTVIFSIKNENKQGKSVLFYLNDDKGTIHIYAISPRIKEFKIIFTIEDNETGYSKQLKGEELYDNGYSLLINPSKESILKMTIISTHNTMITIGSRSVSNEYKKIVKALDIIYGAIQASLLSQDCFEFTPDHQDKPNSTYIINMISYTEDVYYSLTALDDQEDNKKEEILIKDSLSTVLNSSEKNKYLICFTVKRDENLTNFNDASGFTFQILNKDHLYESQLYLRPLINGKTTTGILPSKTILIHRLENNYKHAKSTEIILKRYHNNDLYAYGTKCYSFSDCRYNENKIKDDRSYLTTAHYIRDVVQIKLNSFNPNDSSLSIAIIYCNSTSLCKYTISMKIENDWITLPIKRIPYKAITIEGVDKYTFRYYNSTMNYINIALFSFTGKAELMVYNDIEMKNKIGKYSSISTKEIYIISKDSEGSLTGDYYITVKGISNSYYSIYIYDCETLSNINLRISIGEIFLERLSPESDKKNLVFYRRVEKEEDSNGFLITINIINCNVSLSYEGNIYNSLEYDNNVQFYISNESIEDKYEITAELIGNNYSAYNSDISCQIIIATSEISSKYKILLNEGFKHSAIFNAKFNEITYNYPYFNVGYEEVLVLLITASEPIEYSYSIDSKNFSKYMTFINSNKLLISSYQLDLDCFIGDFCNVIIKLRRKKIEPMPADLCSIKFSIKLTATNVVPIYLEKEKLHLDNLSEDKELYYYSDINKDEEGEIMINFLRGSGYAIGKIVKKTEIENEPNWVHRVHLPDKYEKNRLPYDYFSSKINYNKSHTNECENYGCELYITIFSTEKESSILTSFSILIRRLKGNYPVFLNINDYYFGSLHPSEINDYYLKIDNFESILVDFNTKSCKINVTEIGNDSKNTSNLNYDTTFTLNRKDFGRTTPDFIHLRFRVYPGSTSQNNIYLYNLRIIPPVKESKLDIIELDFNQNEYCDINPNESKQYCHYIIKVNYNEYLTNGTCVAFHSNSKRLVILYAQTNKELDYNNASREETEANIQTQNMVEYFSSNNVLIILGNPTRKTYSIVTISSPFKGKIQLISNMGHFTKKALLIPDTPQMFHLQKNKEMEIMIRGKNTYHCEIVWIQGSGYVTKVINNGAYIEGINSLTKSISILIDPIDDDDLENKANIIKINSKESNLIYSIIYYIRAEHYNLDQLKLFLLSSYFYDKPTSLPIKYYSNVDGITEDIITIFYFENFTYCGGDSLIHYNIVSTLTESDILNIESLNKIENKDLLTVNGTFNPFFQIGYSKIRCKEKNSASSLNTEKYLINSIEAFKTDSCSELSQIRLKILSIPVHLSDDFPSNETDLLPYNTFIISTLDNQSNHSFALGLHEKKGNFMEIELISSVTEIDIALMTIAKESNVSSIVVGDRITFKEKIIINLTLLEDEIGVKINLKANLKESVSLTYALKYKLSAQAFMHCNIPSKILKIVYGSKNTKIVFSSIRNEDNISIQADYKILFFNYTICGRNLTNEEQSLLFLTDTPMKLFYLKTKNDNPTISFETNEVPVGDYYVTVMAMTNMYNHDEMLQYDVQFAKLASNGMEHLWIILLIGIVVIAIAFISCLFLNKRKKKGLLTEIDDSSTFQSQTISNENGHSKED